MMRRLDLPRVLLATYLGLAAVFMACSDGGTGPDDDDDVRPPPPPPPAERIETNFDDGAFEGWEVDGERAFESDIRFVLAAVGSIEIRGSRRLAPDGGFIDRVILAPPFQASGAVGQR